MENPEGFWWTRDPEVLFNPAVAQLYDLFAWPFVFMTTAGMLRELDGFDGEILEIGCGTGLATAQLARVGRVTAVDPSRYMLGRAAVRIQRLNLGDRVRLLMDRAAALPVESARYDAVVLSYVLRHLKPEALDTVAQEIRRVSRPGARLLIADLRLPLTGAFPEVVKGNPSYTILGTLSVYDPPGIVAYMEKYGLRLKSLVYYPLSFLLVLEGDLTSSV